MSPQSAARIRRLDEEFARLDAISRTRALTDAESARLYQLHLTRNQRLYAEQRCRLAARRQHGRAA